MGHPRALVIIRETMLDQKRAGHPPNRAIFNNANGVTSGTFVIGWFGASALGGVAVLYGPPVLQTAGTFVGYLALNPTVQQRTTEFIEGFTPGSPWPATPWATGGATASQLCGSDCK